MKGRFRLGKILSRIGNERRLIENKLATLRAVDPKTSLKRGFSLLYKQDGVLIKSIAQVEQGGVVVTDLSDGKISSTVNSIKEKNHD
jgi:exodeoxyribonuclease VII large subunit